MTVRQSGGIDRWNRVAPGATVPSRMIMPQWRPEPEAAIWTLLPDSTRIWQQGARGGEPAMPMSSSQLAALVDRARQKAPPAVSPPLPPPVARPQRPVPAGHRAPGPPAPSPRRRSAAPASTPLADTDRAGARIEAPPPESSPTPAPEPVAAPEDFPEGWALTKESWYFHRRFYRVFRRPMLRGEYSDLLWQIRHRRAERLGDDCWRVTLPDGRRTLSVRATTWRLITILPKNWQPPAPAEEHAEIETSAA
jgi:hypothetical protein